jgi:hypothetical protein
MAPFRTSSVLKAIGEPRLKLVAGKGYWYFVFDDTGKLYDTHTVFVMRLSDLPLERWIEEGKDFVQEMKARCPSCGSRAIDDSNPDAFKCLSCKEEWVRERH